MTDKKRYIIKGIYFILFVFCIFTFDNATLNFCLLLLGLLLSSLLKGYSQDYKNRQKNDESHL